MEIWHLTFASASRLPLFPTEAARLIAAACIARVAGCLLMFEIADDHVHVEIACSRDELAARRSALSRALGTIAAVPLVASHVQPVRSRAHLLRNVRYFLTQPGHHGPARDLALDPGSCFQDLVGARCLPGFDPMNLKRALPRVTRVDLLEIVGLPATALEPATPETVRRAGVSAIVRACAAVVAVPHALRGRGLAAVQARRAAVHTCDAVGLSRRDLAHELGVSDRAIRYSAREPVPRVILRAVPLRLAIEAVRRTRVRDAS
jgi:hypothetical protein